LIEEKFDFILIFVLMLVLCAFIQAIVELLFCSSLARLASPCNILNEFACILFFLLFEVMCAAV